jgi:hypothetical protein
MSFLAQLLALTAAATSLEGVYAKLDLSSSSNVAVYWGMSQPYVLCWESLTDLVNVLPVNRSEFFPGNRRFGAAASFLLL